MSLKALAEKVLERTQSCNQDATAMKTPVQLRGVKTPLKVALVAHVELAIKSACQGLEITPEQFAAICTKDDLDLIANGSYNSEYLRGYARSFAEGIRSRRIVFHPKTGELVCHG